MQFSTQTLTPRTGLMSSQQQGTANPAPKSEFKEMQRFFIGKAHGAYSNMFSANSSQDQKALTNLIKQLHDCKDRECIMQLITPDVDNMLNKWGSIKDTVEASFVRPWR